MYIVVLKALQHLHAEAGNLNSANCYGDSVRSPGCPLPPEGPDRKRHLHCTLVWMRLPNLAAAIVEQENVC